MYVERRARGAVEAIDAGEDGAARPRDE